MDTAPGIETETRSQGLSSSEEVYCYTGIDNNQFEKKYSSGPVSCWDFRETTETSSVILMYCRSR